MFKPTLAALSALFFLSGSATAAPPAKGSTIVGAYNLAFHDTCSNQLVVDYANGGAGQAVDSIGLNAAGSHQYLFAVNFFSTGGLSFGGYKDGGTTVTAQDTGLQSGTLGNPITEDPQSGTGTFSNTATTLTINGQTFHAVYDNIDPKGVAHGFKWMGLFPDGFGGSCSQQGEGTRVQ